MPVGSFPCIFISDTQSCFNVFRIDESETDKNQRVQKWETFLETGEEVKKDITADEVKSTEIETISSSSEGPVAEEQQQSESDNADTEIETS